MTPDEVKRLMAIASRIYRETAPVAPVARVSPWSTRKGDDLAATGATSATPHSGDDDIEFEELVAYYEEQGNSRETAEMLARRDLRRAKYPWLSEAAV